ncbi:MAG: SDR family oxidoreductase [Candidatus Zixiibacteriota bacterium]
MAIDITTQKILVTGASGSLGKQLLYELTKYGVKPVAHVRETSDTNYIDSLNLEKRIADLRSPNDIDRLVDGIDLIIHTAAWVNFRQDRLTQFTGLNTFGAVNLFNAARKAKVKRFVHVSTIAAIGAIRREFDNINKNRANILIDEKSEFNLGHLQIPYIMTKHAAEDELEKVKTDNSTELVIVNPSIIVAPSSTGSDREKAMRLFNKIIFPYRSNRVNLVDIRDIAPAIITALEKGRPGQRYIFAGDNITVKDLALAVSAILGKTPHLVRFPRYLYNFAANFSALYGKLLGRGKVSFYPDLVKMFDYDWAYSSAKARKELDYKSRSIYETLQDLLTNNFTGSYMKPENNSKHSNRT